jgi:type II secretion system protein D
MACVTRRRTWGLNLLAWCALLLMVWANAPVSWAQDESSDDEEAKTEQVEESEDSDQAEADDSDDAESDQADEADGESDDEADEAAEDEASDDDDQADASDEADDAADEESDAETDADAAENDVEQAKQDRLERLRRMRELARERREASRARRAERENGDSDEVQREDDDQEDTRPTRGRSVRTPEQPVRAARPTPRKAASDDDKSGSPAEADISEEKMKEAGLNPEQVEMLRKLREMSPSAEEKAEYDRKQRERRAAEKETPAKPSEVKQSTSRRTTPTRTPTSRATAKPDSRRPTRGVTRTPTATPAETSSDSTVITDEQYEVVEPGDSDEHWFNYVDYPWEDVIKDFARRLGKPLMDSEELIIGGTLTYRSERVFTAEEAINELNLLLHEKGFHFLVDGERVRVLETQEMPEHVPLNRIYNSVAEFEADDLPDFEYAVVFMKVEGKDASDIIETLGKEAYLPLDFLISTWAETNRIKMSGIARDIRRFLSLLEMIPIDKYDPRTMKVFVIKTNVRTVESMLRQLFGSGAPRRTYNPQTRKWETNQSQSTLQITADERTNSLILRGMRDEIEEAEELIKLFDDKPPIEFTTKIHKIEYASATEVYNVLTQILQVEQGSSSAASASARARNLARQRAAQARARANARRGRDRNQDQNNNANQANQSGTIGSTNPEEIFSEGAFEQAKKTIRLAAIERDNSLAVYATQEGHDRVEEMLKDIDQPQPTNLNLFTLEHVSVEDVEPILSQIVSNITANSRSSTIIPDPSQNGFLVLADPGVLANIEEIIKQLDVPSASKERHIVGLENVSPSEMVTLLQQYLGSGGGTVSRSSSSARARLNRSRSRRGAVSRSPVAVSSTAASGADFIALDGQQTLIVLCTPEDWIEIEEFIQLTDGKPDMNVPELIKFEIEKGDPDGIVQLLQQFYSTYQRPPFPPSQVLISADGNTIYVQAVPPALEEIGALITSLDVEPKDDGVVVLELDYADASQVANYLNSIMGGGAVRRGRRVQASTGPSIQPEPMTNSLIVQANRADLEKIMKFAHEMDERIGAQEPERRFFVMRYANPRDVVQALNSHFNNSVAGSRRGGTPAGSRVTASQSGKQLIVEAPAEKFAEIESFIQQLDDPKGGEIVIKTIKLQGTDVAMIASKLSNAFREKTKQQGSVARFDADPQSETILLTCSQDVVAEAETLISEYVEASAGLMTNVEFIQLKQAQADAASRWLGEQLTTAMQKQYGRNVRNLIKVTADARTNRVIINAPAEAVERGKALLEQYDIEGQQVVVNIETETYKLPGLDINALSRNLTTTFVKSRPRRTDGLQATFTADQITETLIVSAPKDMVTEIQEVIDKFVEETEDLAPIQEFIDIQYADAHYIADQVRNLLKVQIERTRGRAVANRVNVTVENRLNRVIINAPKFAMEWAQALITKLDVKDETPSDLIKTIPLANADANVVYDVLRRVLEQEMKTDRTLKISAESLTNSLIVTAKDDTFEQIKQWAEKLDNEAATTKNETRIFTISNANPWELHSLLTQRFIPRGWGRRQQPGKEITFAIVNGTSMVASAPNEKMNEIAAFIEQIDQETSSRLEVRTYQLVGIGDQIDNFARNLERAINDKITGQSSRERRVSIATYPNNDTLIVTALTDQFSEIESMMDRFKDLFEGETLVSFTVDLVFLDARQAAPLLESMVANRVSQVQRRGRGSTQGLSITADPRTNRLFITAPDRIEQDIRTVIAELDVESKTKEGELRTIPLAAADAQQMVQTLQPVYREKARQKKDDVSYVPVTLTAESLTNSVLVVAGDDDFEEIKAEATRIDEAMVVADVKPVRIELEFADPSEIKRTIDTMFPSQRRGRSSSITDEVISVVANNSLIVKAPPAKLEEIRSLVTSVDTEDSGRTLVVRTFQLKVLNAREVAQQVGLYLISISQNYPRGAMKPTAFAEPTTNSLVVLAPEDKFPFIEGLITKIESNELPEAIPQQYALEFARAEQIAPSIESMLKAKASERSLTGGKQQVQYSVQAEPRSNSLLVFAPDDLQNLTAELIAMLDREIDTGEIIHIIPLVNSEAASLATTLGEIISGKKEQTSRRQVPWWAPQPAASSDSAAGAKVSITADENSNSLLLKGLPKEVARVEELIEDLEEMSASNVPELQIFKLKNISVEEAQAALDARFGADRDAGSQVSYSTDDYTNRVYVTTTRRKMRLVEAFIEGLDQADTDTALNMGGGRQLYFVDVLRGDAVDVAWEVSSLLPFDGPSIEADWFGDYIKVTARESEYDQVVKLIREVEQRVRVERDREIIDIGRLLTLEDIRKQFPDLKFETDTAHTPQSDSMIIDVWDEGELPPVKRRKQAEEAKRARAQADSTDTLPMVLAEEDEAARDETADENADIPAGSDESRRDLSALRRAVESQLDRMSDDDEPSGDPEPVTRRFANAPRLAAAQPVVQPAAAGDSRSDRKTDEKSEEAAREEAVIRMLPNGRIEITGPADAVDKVRDYVDLFDESEEGEVIRIFRFQYGDVNTAAQILDSMFNEAQTRTIQPSQRQQRPGQNQQGNQGQNQQQQMLQQFQQLQQLQDARRGSSSSGGRNVRIATDPSRNYLIVKCDESDLEDIQELLKILDDIPEVEVNVRVFQLRNLEANETAGNIEAVLGISKSSGGAATSAGRSRGGRGNQQQLMQMLEQQMVAVAGGRGTSAKIESVEIVPNTATNALLVSAPLEVMTIIEDVLDDLEELNARDVVGIHAYELQQAKVDDVLPLLEEVFAGVVAARGSKSPAAWGAVTVTGDPRNNTIIFTCENKDVEKVIAQIETFDIAGQISDGQVYVVRFGDAEAIAGFLNEIYSQDVAVQRGQRGAPSRSSTSLRIIAEPSTNTLVIWGPEEKRAEVLTRVEDLDQRSRRDFREITVAQAEPTKLAEKLNEMFGGITNAGAAASGRGARGGARGGSNAQTVIIGDDDLDRLFVRATDEVFDQILDMVEVLDQPAMNIQMRRFELRHAKAEEVVDSLRSAMTEYFQISRATDGEAPDLDAFVPVPDPRTNSIAVVGTDQTFLFVENALALIDVPTPEDKRQTLRVFALEYADATMVADTINSMTGSAVVGGGRGNRGNRGSAQATASEFEVNAVAELSSNSVLVFGPADDIDEVYARVIEPVEQSLEENFEPEVIPVRNARASQVANFIRQFLSPGGMTSDNRGRDQQVSSEGPHIVPNDNNNTIVVRGTTAQKARIAKLVEQFDSPEIVSGQMRLIQIPPGQDSAALAADVEAAVNRGEEILAEAQNRNPDLVVLSANAYTNTIIVTGDPGAVGQAESMIEQLVALGPQRVVRTFIDLDNLDIDEALRIIEEVQNQQNSATGSGRSSSSNRRSGSGASRGGSSRSRDSGRSFDSGRSRDSSRRSGGSRRRSSLDPRLNPKTIEAQLHLTPATPAIGAPLITTLILPMIPAVDESLSDSVSQSAQRSLSAIRAAITSGATVNPEPQLQPGVQRVRLNQLGSRQRLSTHKLRHYDTTHADSGEGLFAPRLASEAQSRGLDFGARVVTVSDRSTATHFEPVAPVMPAVPDEPSAKRPARRVKATQPSETSSTLLADIRQRIAAREFARPVSFQASDDADESADSSDEESVAAQQAPLEGEMEIKRGTSARAEREDAKPESASEVRQQQQTPRRGRRVAQRERDQDTRDNARSRRATGEVPARAPRRNPAPDRSTAANDDVDGNLVPADELDLSLAASGQLKGEVFATEVGEGRLMLQGDEADVAFFVLLLRQMEASAPRPSVKVIPLVEAKAGVLAETISQTVQNLIESRGGGDRPADRFSVTAEARSNRLIVSASEDNMALIESIIAQLDVKSDRDVSVERVPLTHIRASEAAAKLTPIIERLNAIREVPSESAAKVEADDRSNSLLIIGTRTEIEEILEYVAAMDIELTEAEKRLGVSAEMQIVNLKNGQAEDVANVLRDMITAEQDAANQAAGNSQAGIPAVRRLRLTAPDGTELPPLDLEKPIRLISEQGTNSIIVFSTPENNEALLEIIDVFDTLPIGAETEVRAITLRYATAEQVATTLEEVFTEGRDALARPSEESISSGQLPPLPSGAAARGLPYNVAITHDARSNTVFVIGRKDAVTLAIGLVKEMDLPSQDLGVRPRVVKLQNVPATQVEEKISELLDERAQQLGSSGTERDVAVIKSDERSNSVIIVANDDVFEMAEELIDTLDASDTYSIVATEYRRLEFADAIKLQGLLEGVFEAKDTAHQESETETQNTLTVIADARANALVLTGTRDYLAEARRLINDLDREFDATVEFRAFEMQFNSAANVSTLLEEMVEQAYSGGDSDVTGAPIYIKADTVTDQLLVAASREDMLKIGEWVSMLDVPSAVVASTKIIPISRGSAEDVAERVQEIFEGVGEDGTRVVVTHDPMTNAVIINAPPPLVRDAARVVEQIIATEPGQSSVVRIFKLDQADAEDAAELLNNILQGEGSGGGGSTSDALNQVILMYQEKDGRTYQAMRSDIVVIADVRTNSLVVTSPAPAVPLMQSLVTAIDVPPDAARIRVFALRNSDAQQMVDMLTELFEERTSAGTDSGTGEIRQLALDGLAAGGRQEISFAADPRTNSLIAAGTPGYLDIVEEFVLSIDSQDIKDRVTEVYIPRNIPADSIVATINEYSDAQRELLEELGSDEVSAQRIQESQIDATANTDSNTVVLTFDPRRYDDVMRLVRDIDQPPPQVSIEVLIVEISSDRAIELGVEFAAQDLAYTRAGVNDTNTFDLVGGTDIGAAGSGLGGFSFTISGRDFNFLLHALQTESDLNVLSRPHITVLDGQEAQIVNRENVPFVTGQTTGAAGTTTSVSREPIGIELTVTPQINPDGFVRLEIEQTVESLTDSAVAIGAGVTQPITFERTTNTVVSVRDNETVVLGGLITERDERSENKVPLVGDIPVVGSLFRFDQSQRRSTELLVILTPRIIRTPRDFRDVSLMQRDASGIVPSEVLTAPIMRGLRIKEEDLPADGDEFGPFDARDHGDLPQYDEDAGDDDYGPLHDLGRVREALRSGEATDETGYDLPIRRREAVN